MKPREVTINWVGATFLILAPIIGVVLTIYHLKTEGFIWPIWAMAAVLYVVTSISITGGYHRFWAHKTYEARTWLKWFWALFGAAAYQNSIFIWARDHRMHHRFVDTDLDPYSINKGFWYAHMGWMLVNETPGVPIEPFGRDLERDPVVMFQHKHYILVATLVSFGIPIIGGYFLGSVLGGIAVAGFLRITLLHHATFCINSWCHYWGKQRYTDTNTAKDSFIMAVATMGEGYHNFHHYFANDYRNGIRWYHWDPTKWLIQFFHMLGGAYSLRRTPWREIIKAQLQMDEKQLKSRFDSDWQVQFQAQLDNLKVRVEQAHERFEKLKEEYKLIAANYAQSSMDRLEETKRQMRIAKMEFKAALDQWRAYHSFLLKTAQA